MKSLLKAFTEKKDFFFFLIFYILYVLLIHLFAFSSRNLSVWSFLTRQGVLWWVQVLKPTSSALSPRSSSCISHCPHSSSLLCLSFPHPEFSSSFPTYHLFWCTEPAERGVHYEWPVIFRVQTSQTEMALVQLSMYFFQNACPPLFDICFSLNLKEFDWFDTISFYQMYLKFANRYKSYLGVLAKKKSHARVSFISLGSQATATLYR